MEVLGFVAVMEYCFPFCRCSEYAFFPGKKGHRLYVRKIVSQKSSSEKLSRMFK